MARYSHYIVQCDIVTVKSTVISHQSPLHYIGVLTIQAEVGGGGGGESFLTYILLV